MVICLKRGADLHTATTVSCFSKIQIGFTFVVLAHPGSPGKMAVKRMQCCHPRRIAVGGLLKIKLRK